jgi:hypothetical protein
MELFCPFKGNPQWKELVQKLGDENLAYFEWMRQELGKDQNESNNPTIEVPGSKPITEKRSTSLKNQQKYAQVKHYLSNRLNRLSTEFKSVDPASPKGLELSKEIGEISKKIENNENNASTKSYVSFGKDLVAEVESSLKDLKSGKIKPTITNISRNREILEIFKGFKNLTFKITRLQNELEPFVDKVMTDEVNKFSTEKREITSENIFDQKSDINRVRKGFGALSDVADYLGRTIGSKIKAAQNKISSENKHLTDKIQKEVDALKSYQKKQGITGVKTYEPFIQDFNGTTILTREYTSDFYTARDKALVDLNSEDENVRKEAENWIKENLVYEDGKVSATNSKYINPKYEKIQKTPELKRFYDFHKEITNQAKTKIPVEIGEDFIANIKNTIASDVLQGDKKLLSGLKEGIKDIIKIKSFNEDSYIGDEDLSNDILPLRYVRELPSEEKSSDLGENLLKFASFANSYNEMSNILPEIRLLQDQIASKKYIKSSDPSTTIEGENSNIFKMVDDYVNMQVKGKVKSDEGKLTIGSTFDENGNKTGEKYILASDVVDFGLRYNSLLRIGLNPINAVTNYLIGDIGNIIEGFGNKFYSLGDLKTATGIFFKQNFKQDSTMNTLLEDLNPLQELDDYEAADRVRLKGSVSLDNLKNIAYKPQQMGEKFLQTRTMLAVMLKDGLLDKNGETTKKYKDLTEGEKSKLADKIQRLNQSIHGRYSSRDAATLQQNVLFRALIQFRKWIPAAIESRFGGKQYDNRLGTEIEGRYQTAVRLLVKDLRDTLSRLQSGKLTELEIYNMRKNLVDTVILIGTVLAYNGLKGDDDDKKWRAKPGVKFALDQLNRVSGDLLFFYSPSQYNKLAQNAVPLSKTVGDLISVVNMTPYLFYNAGKEEIYQSGPRKGENKFWSRFSSLVPGFKPAADLKRIWNGVDFQEIK